MDLLREADGSVKLALLMASAGLDRDSAVALLEAHQQQLRRALQASGAGPLNR